MAVLRLRAMRGWNKTETACHFLVSDDTVRTWLRRADDDSLVQTRTPVNRFPDFVRYVVQQVKSFCPTLGKVKIVDKLALASIHIGKTTVGRILKEKPVNVPDPTTDDSGKQCRIVSPCAQPQVDIQGDPGNTIILEIDCHEGRRHLPVMRARRVA